MIGYIPAIFYSNMFSLAFLEIKAKTKFYENKSASDFKIGLKVIVVITLSYALLYLPIIIGNSSTGDSSGGQLKRNLLVGTYDALVVMPSPFVHRSQMTLFDLQYMLTFVMLTAQAVVLLQVARENLLIFVEEHVNQKLSKALDQKKRGGVKTEKKQVGARGPEGVAPAHGNSRSNLGQESENQQLLTQQNRFGS